VLPQGSHAASLFEDMATESPKIGEGTEATGLCQRQTSRCGPSCHAFEDYEEHAGEHHQEQHVLTILG
jgi:hypothetical protein